jgi:hypothetical protein
VALHHLLHCPALALLPNLPQATVGTVSWLPSVAQVEAAFAKSKRQRNVIVVPPRSQVPSRVHCLPRLDLAVLRAVMCREGWRVRWP